ncbi:MAG: NAD(+)/NADH kinase [Candidatus Acidiferrales bacterium]|jgi:NAD+ kinase
MIRTTGIICKPIKEMVSTVVPPLMAWLAARGVSSYLDQQTATTVGAHDRGLRRDEMGGKIDWLIVLGGDGTLLSAARAMGANQVPILAVNLGGLGFLTSVTLEELYSVLEKVLDGKANLSERMMLQAEILHDGKTSDKQIALNDAVANKAALARMLDFDVHVDGHHVGRYRADGLIVATPTGSTAYSLAAGGPIIHPDLDAFVITPICPHMLTNRPLVVPDTARVELDFAVSHEPVYLTMDGQIGFQLDAKDRVVITKSSNKVQVVKPTTMTYYEILRSKLRWSER